MTIAAADLLEITDSLGVMYDNLLALAATTEGAALATGGTNNADRVLDLTDIDIVKDLSAGFDTLKDNTAAPYATAQNFFGAALAAIQRHTGGLNAYLTNNTAKVSRSFADLWRSIYGNNSLSAANVFQEPSVVGRTGAITGASAVTNTAGTDLDQSLVAPSQYEVHCTVDIAGSSTPTLTLTMKKAGGTTEVKTVGPLDDNFDAGDVVDVGTSSDVYIGCTLIAVADGGASGTIQVRNKLLRTPVI